MKKHLSVLALSVRIVLYKVLAICALSAVLQIGLCIFSLPRGTAQDGPAISLEFLIGLSSFGRIAGVAFLAVCAVLCFCGCDRSSSHSGYTLRRLSVGERTTVLWAAAANAGMLLLLWASQLAVALVINLLYRQTVPASQLGDQSLLIAFYRSGYLHALLPLREISLFVRNLILLAGLSICCAIFSYHQRRGRYRLEPLILALFALFYFSQEVGSFGSDLVLIFVALAIGGFALFSLRGGVTDEASS